MQVQQIVLLGLIGLALFALGVFVGPMVRRALAEVKDEAIAEYKKDIAVLEGELADAHAEIEDVTAKAEARVKSILADADAKVKAAEAEVKKWQDTVDAIIERNKTATPAPVAEAPAAAAPVAAAVPPVPPAPPVAAPVAPATPEAPVA